MIALMRARDSSATRGLVSLVHMVQALGWCGGHLDKRVLPTSLGLMNEAVHYFGWG